MASIATADTGKYLTLQKGCTEFDTDVGEVVLCVEHSVAESARDNKTHLLVFTGAKFDELKAMDTSQLAIGDAALRFAKASHRDLTNVHLARIIGPGDLEGAISVLDSGDRLPRPGF